MGAKICICSNDALNVKIPASDLTIDNQQKKDNSKMEKSILLPNGNNPNSFYESRDIQMNQNNEEFSVSLSPIAKDKKSNININIININNDPNSNNNFSKKCNIKNNEDSQQQQNQGGGTVIEESDEKENSNSQEEEENQENKKEESKKQIQQNSNKIDSIILEFDNKIKEYGEFISEEELQEAIGSVIKNTEYVLGEFLHEKKNEKNSSIFSRPPLLFKDNKFIYKGSWHYDGYKEGFGILIDNNGNKYIGDWKKDKLNGKGRLLSINGDYYEGEFKNGLIEGYGIFHNKKDGYTYKGYFKNNKFEGDGEISYDNSMKYKGTFEDGYKNGEGILSFNDGTYYQGHFEKNVFEGKGFFKFKDGRTYKGEWKNNNMEGKGEFVWNRETKYYGSYKCNIREGNGIYYFGPNYYDGNWVNNMPHGEGTLCNDGCKIVGNFRFGKIQKMNNIKGVNKVLKEKLTQQERVRTKENLSNTEEHASNNVNSNYNATNTNNSNVNNNNTNSNHVNNSNKSEDENNSDEDKGEYTKPEIDQIPGIASKKMIKKSDDSKHKSSKKKSKDKKSKGKEDKDKKDKSSSKKKNKQKNSMNPINPMAAKSSFLENLKNK